jgi:hypothetical protein
MPVSNISEDFCFPQKFDPYSPSGVPQKLISLKITIRSMDRSTRASKTPQEAKRQKNERWKHHSERNQFLTHS